MCLTMEDMVNDNLKYKHVHMHSSKETYCYAYYALHPLIDWLITKYGTDITQGAVTVSYIAQILIIVYTYR